MSKYWTACQVMPGIEHKVRAEIEKGDRGAFLPTLAKVWVSGGKVSSRECPMIPGYVFFMTEADDWGQVADVDGVQRVLTMGQKAKPVDDDEMCRMVLDHAMGEHNYIDRSIRNIKAKERKKQRKRRSGRRIRKVDARNRTGIGTHGKSLHGESAYQ